MAHHHAAPTHGRENPHAGQGPVLLDIGGTVGALVVDLPAAMEGTEVEVRDLGAPGRPPRHVAVVARPGGAGTAYTLVYPDLEEGTYALHVLPDGPVALVASVTGGRVTRTTWPRGHA